MAQLGKEIELLSEKFNHWFKTIVSKFFLKRNNYLNEI